MMRKILVALAIIAFAYALFPLFWEAGVVHEPGALATAYLERSPKELGTANVVTAIVVSYRGFDTLGEVAVLFTATAGVGALLAKRRKGAHAAGSGADAGSGAAPGAAVGAAPGSGAAIGSGAAATEILVTATQLLSSLLVLFGVYIFTHGHLTPGGGFQGGVVIASAVLLNLLAAPQAHFAHGIMTTIESLSGAFYVALGLLGAFLAWGFLDPRVLPIGTVGSLVSAGTIPLIYSMIGLKVGAELSGILSAMKDGGSRP